MTTDRTLGGSTAGLALYHSPTCWYCAKVRQKVGDLKLDLELRDIGASNAYRNELMQEGGKGQVPCLRIEHANGVEWKYESADICSYLEQRFGTSAA
jgi:glutathione S-transferase